ncbi:MAG: hypothetical protein K9K78_04430 [Spirochaetales bacterium]|nr:hypothetical protein [Spirochaetales bacterium]
MKLSAGRVEYLYGIKSVRTVGLAGKNSFDYSKLKEQKQTSETDGHISLV